jgi:Predicted membrane protein
MQVLSKFKKNLKSPPYRRETTIRLLLAFISGLGISLVIVSGPYVQSVFTSFISGDNSSLYEGIYKTGIGGFPTIGAYVRAAFWPPYLVFGMSVAIAMVWLNSKRSFLVGVSLVAATGFTAIDVMSGTSSIHELTVSIICNILGGIILALFSFIIAANTSVIRLVSEGNRHVERIIFIIFPAFCYIVLVSAILFILAFIIKIPSASVSVRLSPPMSGYVSSIDPMHCKNSNNSDKEPANCYDTKTGDNKDADRFDVLSDFSPINDSEQKWAGLGRGLSIDWKKKNSAIVKATFHMAEGCMTREQLKQILKTPPFEKDVVMGDHHIEIDSGLSQFRVITSNYTDHILLSDRNSLISEFWIIPSTNKPSKINVNRFVLDGFLKLNDQFKPFSYEIGVSPYGEKDGWLKSRRLNFVSKNPNKSKFIDIQFDPRPINPNLAVSCRELKLTPVRGGYIAMATKPFVSMIVSIDHSNEISYKDLENPDDLEVVGLNGWVSSDNFDKSRIDVAVKTGKIGMISVFGAINDVQVNDKAVVTGPTSTLQLTGTLTGNTDGPSILINGDADYMILNGHRMTLTRWESLDMEMRVPIIFGIPTILYFLLRILSEALRRPMRHVWYQPR